MSDCGETLSIYVILIDYFVNTELRELLMLFMRFRDILKGVGTFGR